MLKRSDGLLPWQKFLLQVVLTAIFVFYIVKYTDISLTMRIPFWSGHFLNLGWLAVPVLFFAVIGTVNGVNFTDGLDGLASSVTLIVAVFLQWFLLNEIRDRADHRCSCGRSDGISVV